MNFRRCAAVVAYLLPVLCLPAGAWAQLPVPRVLSVYPTGARQGTSVEVVCKGENLDQPAGLYFSHPGVTAELLPEQADKKPRFKVAVAADVPVGIYDVRVVSKYGISNPRAFVVGDQEESLEQEPNNEQAQANRVPLNSVVCGLAMPEDVDWFVFNAKQGQRVLIECWAWRIDSRLDGFLWLFDSNGKQLAVSQDENSRNEKTDPLIDFDVPADGDYYVKFSDFLYNGGELHFYRLRIGTAPLIDFALPTGVRPGETTPVTLFGRNLPGGDNSGLFINGRPLDKLTQPVSPPADALVATSLRLGEVLRPQSSLLNGMELRLPSPVGVSNARLLVFSPDPELAEQEPNNRPEEAQRVTLPCAVSGQFNPQKDLDYYVFAAKKNEPITVSVLAQRIGSPADPDMEVLKPPKGDILASPQDDGENIGQLRFATFSRDIRYELTPPQDGDYTLRLEHLYGQLQGGPQYVYRLEITRRTPDFQLVCTPPHETRVDSHVLYRGGHERVDVLVWRLGGHKAPITVTARNLPPGVTAKPFVVNGESKWGTLVLESAADALIGETEIEIVGVSDGETGPIQRLARGGVMTWDTVNTPGIARMTRSIMLAVRDSAPFTVSATPAEFHLQAGQPMELTLHVDRRADMPNDVQFGAAGLPQIKGLDVPLTKVLAGDTQKNLKLDTAKIAPGMYSFILNGEAQVPFEEKPGSKKNIRCLYPTNAVTFEILPKEAAK
jgi:hypothetical protein